MKVSTKGRYGLRIMLDIALNGENGGCVSIKDIAAREQLSDKYLEQIISTLVKADLVSSVRGAKGGYKLKREAALISVADILKATEGSLAPMSCVENNDSCEKYCDCVFSFVWEEMYKAVMDTAGHITLSDIVERSRKLHTVNERKEEIL